MNPEDFRRFGHTLIDWIADYRAGVAERPVGATSGPGEIRARLAAAPPEEPQPLERVLEELEPLLDRGTMAWQHPRFFAYFPANAELSSVLGDLLSSGLGQLGLSWEASPALTELEEHTLDWMRALFGLPDAFRGVIQDTASTSTLVALLCAREQANDFAQYRDGAPPQGRPLTVYCSEQSHSSVMKAALLAGFGQDNVCAVGTDAAYALRPDLLRLAIEDDLRDGRLPCAVVATFGTTGTTAIDPLDAVQDIAREHGLWLHVDAAMAGATLLLPECRDLARGVEGADSIVVNAHKWIGAVFDTSLYFTRRADHLVRVMSTNPSYLRTAADDVATNYRDWGIPLGRRFRALKLWFLLHAEGVEGIRARLRRDLASAAWLSEQVAAAPDWERVVEPRFQTVCLRHVPQGLEGDALDRHNLAWIDAVNRSGKAFLKPAHIGGAWIARVSVGALTTELDDVRALWELLRQEASRIAADASRA